MQASNTRFAYQRMAAIVAAAAVFACSGVRTAWGDDLAARRQQIAGMQPAEQHELLRKFERFNALPVEEQERLRALQTAIDADPRAEELHQVLDRYHEWLKTLTPAERADLAEMSPKERVDQIKRLQQRQHMAREREHQEELLSRSDRRAIVKWAEDVAWKHREQLIVHMPENQRKYFEKNDEAREKPLLLRALAFERSRRPGGHRMTLVEKADVDRLAKRLSEPAKDELLAAGDLTAQRKKLAGWVGTSMHLEAWQGYRRFGSAMGDDLAQFLQHEVPLEKRERLLKMQPDEMRDEVRRLYMQRERGGPPGWLDDKGRDRGKGGPRSGPKGPPSSDTGKDDAGQDKSAPDTAGQDKAGKGDAGKSDAPAPKP